MTRPRVPEKIRTEVAFRSQRICCLCFGLNNDLEQKKGQFAHIDRNPKNNMVNNIAFLCHAHHSEYDTVSNQSAGITIGEAQRYQRELYKFVADRRKRFVADKKRVTSAVDYWTFKTGPTKSEIDKALEFYSGPHRARSGLMQLDDGPKALSALQAAIPGAPDWVQIIIDDLVATGLAFKPTQLDGPYRISPAGVRMLRILDAIPDFIKNAAWRANWNPDVGS